MELTVRYDDEVDVLEINAGRAPVISASLEDDMNVAVKLGTRDGHDIVGILLIHATSLLSPYFAPNRDMKPTVEGRQKHPISNYDRKSDKLDLGCTDTPPDFTTSTGGQLFAYWEPDKSNPDGITWKIVGVSIREVSQHLAPFFKLTR
jgi:hypothetical protein